MSDYELRDLIRDSHVSLSELGGFLGISQPGLTYAFQRGLSAGSFVYLLKGSIGKTLRNAHRMDEDRLGGYCHARTDRRIDFGARRRSNRV